MGELQWDRDRRKGNFLWENWEIICFTCDLFSWVGMIQIFYLCEAAVTTSQGAGKMIEETASEIQFFQPKYSLSCFISPCISWPCCTAIFLSLSFSPAPCLQCERQLSNERNCARFVACQSLWRQTEWARTDLWEGIMADKKNDSGLFTYIFADLRPGLLYFNTNNQSEIRAHSKES